MTGRLPYMTKGPLAMLFGGKEILLEVSDRMPGKHMQILGLVSIIWILSIWCRGNLLTAAIEYIEEP